MASIATATISSSSTTTTIPVPKRSVLVNNVSAEVGPDVLKELFKHVGDVTNVNSLNYDPVSNTKQYQVTFATPDSIQNALKLTGVVIINKSITVVPAAPLDAPPTNPNPNPNPNSLSSGGPKVVEMPPLQGPSGNGMTSLMMQNMIANGPIVPDNNAIEFIDGHRVAMFMSPGTLVLEKNKAVTNPAEGKSEKKNDRIAMNPDAAAIAEKHEQVAKTVYVGNIRRGVTPQQLSAFFSGCGMVTYVCYRGEEIDGPVHYGFLEFDSVESAQRAMTISGAMFEGYPIK